LIHLRRRFYKDASPTDFAACASCATQDHTSKPPKPHIDTMDGALAASGHAENQFPLIRAALSSCGAQYQINH